MPPTTKTKQQMIYIKVLKTLPQAGPAFTKGQRLRVTAAELKKRNVPEDAYQVIPIAAGLPPAPAEAPASSATPEPPDPKK